MLHDTDSWLRTAALQNNIRLMIIVPFCCRCLCVANRRACQIAHCMRDLIFYCATGHKLYQNCITDNVNRAVGLRVLVISTAVHFFLCRALSCSQKPVKNCAGIAPLERVKKWLLLFATQLANDPHCKCNEICRGTFVITGWKILENVCLFSRALSARKIQKIARWKLNIY